MIDLCLIAKKIGAAIRFSCQECHDSLLTHVTVIAEVNIPAVKAVVSPARQFNTTANTMIHRYTQVAVFKPCHK